MKPMFYLITGAAFGLVVGLALSIPYAQESEGGFDMGKVVSRRFQKYHTKGEPDDFYVFQTKYDKGTQIEFHHKYHIEELGLSCVECHHVESCTKCHLKNETHTMNVTEGKIALHENCMGCHQEIGGPTKCDACHKR